MNAFPRLLAIAALLAPAPAAADSATFGRRKAAVGDAIEQSIAITLRLDTTSRQGEAILDQATSEVERRQRRRVTAQALQDGRVVAAEVRFFEAASTHNGATATEPVADKSYRCVREGEKLLVTNAEGVVPPLDEYALVVRAMETLGTASPLAEFLAGRTVAIGERLELPAELAQRTLGFDKKIGTVDSFALTLNEIGAVEGRRVARFAATIEASGGGTGQMGLFIDGTFDIEEATCRVVAAELSGPIAMSGLRGVGVVAHQLDGRGRMQMELTARYRDAVR
ncbi:hypothetical protein Pla108_08550 [Botrimarina colliarenosi]|uniref:Bacterial type II and III secretion system protein n=1 Tax=Botrimarina colliarenosi TaxID=2528001 RepID=A0A5C6AIM5_9BACT|nr:hypothetical protein [Botrimarina colliarenosi]TWT99912.1 hypothetical protein Pla108_08550 [Botrimarina colliarenosi]